MKELKTNLEAAATPDEKQRIKDEIARVKKEATDQAKSTGRNLYFE